jgi:hypothetical protein
MCIGLDINIDRPLMVLKDRPYLEGNIVIDLGKISISNTTKQTEGRWKSKPKHPVLTTTMTITAKDLGIWFNNKEFELAPSFDMHISFEKLNYTSLLDDSYLSKGIDLLDLDISYHINIDFSPVLLRIR